MRFTNVSVYFFTGPQSAQRNINLLSISAIIVGLFNPVMIVIESCDISVRELTSLIQNLNLTLMKILIKLQAGCLRETKVLHEPALMICGRNILLNLRSLSSGNLLLQVQHCRLVWIISST